MCCTIVSQNKIFILLHVFFFFQFIAADVFGLFSSLFCDFGYDFQVTDSDGVEPRDFLIGDMTNVSSMKSQ